jgi:hypothetical protein
MDEVTEWRQSDSFIVRVFRSAGGELCGLIQHARTGDKVRFQDLASLGEAIAEIRRRIIDDDV